MYCVLCEVVQNGVFWSVVGNGGADGINYSYSLCVSIEGVDRSAVGCWCAVLGS